jgi:hypothetical protein
MESVELSMQDKHILAETTMTTMELNQRTLGQKAVDRFTEMMIERMEQMKSFGWHKGWIGSATAPGAMPQNVSGVDIREVTLSSSNWTRLSVATPCPCISPSKRPMTWEHM